MIETYRGVVYPIHLDHMGHMNVQWYVARFDEATWHLFSRLGITTSYIRETGKGMVAVHQTIDYEREALSGDLLVIESAVEKITGKSIHFRHCMRNAETGEALAVTHLVGVHFDRELRQSCPLPAGVAEAGQEFIDVEA